MYISVKYLIEKITKFTRYLSAPLIITKKELLNQKMSGFHYETCYTVAVMEETLYIPIVNNYRVLQKC